MAAPIVALLEDSEQAAQVKLCLENAGHSVYVAASYLNATELLCRHPVSLIMSDVHLENGGNVFDFLKWVKSHQNLKETPFVLFSSEPTELAKYLADGVRTTARLLGADKYISMEKFDPILLSEEITELLSGGTDVQVPTKSHE